MPIAEAPSQEGEPEAMADDESYTKDEWIDWGMVNWGNYSDDDGPWDRARWEAWALEQMSLPGSEVAASSPAKMVLAQAEAAEEPSLFTESDTVAVSDMDDTIADLSVKIGFGSKFPTLSLLEVHREAPWWCKFIVSGKEPIYLKPHAKHLEAGLRILGYLANGSEPATPVTRSTAVPTRAGTDDAAKVRKARALLLQLKDGPWCQAPRRLEEAFAALA